MLSVLLGLALLGALGGGPDSGETCQPQADSAYWIVTFVRYARARTHQRSLTAILGPPGAADDAALARDAAAARGWRPVQRHNAATAKFDTDFALVRLPRRGRFAASALRRLREHPSVRRVDAERRFSRAPLALRRVPSARREAGRRGGRAQDGGDTEQQLLHVDLVPARRRRLLALLPDHGLDVAASVGAPALWRRGVRGGGVRVAVFDTGLRDGHPHFHGAVEERTNWTNEPELSDRVGHGTFVAGMIAGRDSPCPGLAPDARLSIFRVFNSKQVSYTSWFLDAFNYAISSEVDVREATANGIVVVSAIGNDGPLYGTLNNPADMADVIGVGGIGNDGAIARFSSRGMTTHELPAGYGRAKPDVVTHARSLRSSAPGAPAGGGALSWSGGTGAHCQRLTGTSVACPVVAGALALLAGALPARARRAGQRLFNPASAKQVLLEAAVPLAVATPLPSSSSKGAQQAAATAAASAARAIGHGAAASELRPPHLFDQGAGRLNIAGALELLRNYTPRASLYPAELDLTRCPYMWPYCKQPLFAGGMPAVVNVTVLNGMGVAGEIRAVRWRPDAALRGSSALVVEVSHSQVVWPWTGYLGLFVSVGAGGERLDCVVGGTLTLEVVSPRQRGDSGGGARVSALALPVRARVVPPPPRAKRVLWDQFHSLRYPGPYVPRDDLDLESDLLDWHGDHIHTNFHAAFEFLRTWGYYVDVLGGDFTCFDAAQYGTLLLVDPEEEYFPEEARKLEADVRARGLSVVVFADWYSEELVRWSRFFDENTLSWWDAITGGANVPALNELLGRFGIGFGDRVFSTRVTLGGESATVRSGAAIARFPRGGFLLRGAGSVDQGEKLLPRGAAGATAHRPDGDEPALLGALQVAGAGAGRIAVFGDSNCIDTSHMGVKAALTDAAHIYAVRRERVHEGCGQLCSYGGTGPPGALGFQALRKPVNCQALYSNIEADSPATSWPPPRQPPPAMLADYTMGGRVQITPYYFAQKYSGGDGTKDETGQQINRENVWTKDEIDQQVAQARAGTLPGTYGPGETSNVIAGFRATCQRAPDLCVAGKHMMVIGSERPWLEAVLLAEGAARVTTVEYGVIRSEHPQVSTMLPAELREQFLAGALQPFDGVATFSSVEHSGLGRYGDTLNPWGDIQAVAKAWCVTKVGGPLYLGVMPVKNGVEMIEWNAHRRYGPVRLPHLLVNWEQVNKGPNVANVDVNFWQPLFALRRQPAVGAAGAALAAAGTAALSTATVAATSAATAAATVAATSEVEPQPRTCQGLANFYGIVPGNPFPACASQEVRDWRQNQARSRQQASLLTCAEIISYIDADDAMFKQRIEIVKKVFATHMPKLFVHGFEEAEYKAGGANKEHSASEIATAWSKLEFGERLHDATRERPPGQMWIALHHECSGIGGLFVRSLCVHHAHNSIRASLVRDGLVRWTDSPEFYRTEDSKFVSDVILHYGRHPDTAIFMPLALTYYVPNPAAIQSNPG
eukprot:g2288.t1